ncbi:MAG TPA: DUF6644 family protein [Bryobacteraceae bacterium]|jgi:hypothetical protein|nr:DUF6644 family protein [Bryobacteraceae bacterium]
MILEIFQSIENSGVGEAIRDSKWLFPVIEAVHLLGLAVIGGAVLIVDLRLFGYGLRSQPVRQVARGAQPWLIGSLAVMLVTGSLLFSSEATKCYYHDAFWVKMTSLALAILFTFTIRRRVTLSKKIAPVWSKVVAIVSVALWSGVGIGGRWIGFS